MSKLYHILEIIFIDRLKQRSGENYLCSTLRKAAHTVTKPTVVNSNMRVAQTAAELRMATAPASIIYT